MRRLATDIGEGPVVASIEASDSRWADSLGRFATFATWAVLVLLAVSLVARWQAVHYAPWSNMYEFTVAFAAAITLFYAVFERVYARDEDALVPQGPSPERSRLGPRPTAGGASLPPARVLGAVVLPVVLTMLIIAAAFFPSDIQPLVPALQNSDLLAIHVATMILAYGALSVSFAAGALYLVQGPRNRFSRLPRAALLDDVAYRSVMVGFPLLAAGIALGAYWANSAWGRYWAWDPKETSALVTWLIYGIYLHMRGLRNWSGTRSAAVLVAGFAAVIFTYFVVNLWVSGLHSYAGV
ncbi:MAG: cytochrome c biogenesis protein CcsA [Dehalococcoidia bacterium]|nr:cytochrome c biogenesis protein CcsA [Dehalococcoidia bacterium]